MNVKTITVGAFQENCYLVVDDRSNRAVIVDPGSEGERVVDAIESSGATLEAIWITRMSAFSTVAWSFRGAPQTLLQG